MDLVTLVTACALSVEPKLMHALIWHQSGGEPWAVAVQNEPMSRVYSSMQDAVSEVHSISSAGWRPGQSDRGDDRTYNSTGYRSPGARASQAQAEPADDGGRYCDRAAGAQAEEARAVAF